MVDNSNTTAQETVDEDATDAESSDTRRRRFMTGSAGVIGGLAVGGAFAGSALAQDDDNGDGGEDDEESGGPDSFADDVEILNYALTLEYLEAAFYKEGLDNIGEEGLCSCGAFDPESGLGERAFGELRTIQEQEEAHVEALISTIEDLGGEPVNEPEFDFGLATQYPMAFLATAVQLEDTGVGAYAGAAPSIENADLVPTALGIHSVEARHASFLRTLTDQTGFPNVVDSPLSKSTVLEAAGQFIMTGDGEDGDGGETGDGESGEGGDE